MAERESFEEEVEEGGVEPTAEIELLPRGLIRVDLKDEEFRVAYTGETIHCYGQSLYRTGDKHYFRRVNWQICLVRCWIRADFWQSCETLQKFLEDVYDGVAPIIRQRIPEKGSAGYYLDCKG